MDTLRRAVISVLAGALAVTGCTSDPPDADSSGGDFTVTDGAQFVVRAAPDRVVLKTSAGTCGGCKLIDALRRDSGGEIATFGALVGKVILIHPVKGRADDGAFMRVESVAEAGGQLTLAGASVRLEEIADLAERDVVRIYLDRALPLGSRPNAFVSALTPQAMPVGVRPAGFGGLLVGDAPTVIVWPSISHADFLGTLEPRVSALSFRPEVRLDWQSGQGLEVGLRTELAAEAGVDVAGILGGSGGLFFVRAESPDVTMLAPSGLALPFRLSFSASFECSVVGGGQVDIRYDAGVRVRAGGSARIRPRWGSPASQWISEGAWPFEAGGDVTSSVGKFELAPRAGIWCTVRLHANFAPKWFPSGALYIAIAPEMFLSAAARKPDVSVSLRAGASAPGGLTGEVTLLSWAP